MKRLFLFALFVFTVLGLPVTAAQAQFSQAQMDPGCNADVMNLLQDQGNAMRARNRAYERDILNRQPSTLYLTCFDQAMVVSARLGFIFSDNIPPNPPPANNVAFTNGGPNGAVPPGSGAAGTVAFPDWGATHMLALDLDSVVTPELDGATGWLTVPVAAPAEYNFLPLPAESQLTTLVATLTPIINEIKAFQAGPDATGTPNSDEQDYIALVMQIETLVDSFPTLAWTALPAALAQYTTLTGQLAAVVAAVEAQRAAVMGPYLADLKAAVFALNMTCTNLDDLWDGANNFANPAATDYYPPEGTYYPLTPYYTLQDLLNGAWPNAMPDFTQELGNATDNAILGQALQDIMPPGPFAEPANSVDWPPPPQFAPNVQGQDVIQAM